MPAKKQPKLPKEKKIKLSKRSEWQQILKEVDKGEIPVVVLQGVVVNLRDGTTVHIDIQELLAEGRHPGDIQNQIDERLSKLDDYIVDVEMFIDVDQVAAVVQRATDSLLKNM
jgi:hypothetical protein